MSEDRLVPFSSDQGPERSNRAKRAFQGSVAKELRLEVGPRRVGQMLDQALETFRAGFFRYVMVAMLIILPERIFQASLGADFLQVDVGSAQPFDVGFVLRLLTLMVPAIVTLYLAQLVVSQMAYADLRGTNESTWVGLGRVAKSAPALVLIVTLAAIGQFIGFCFCCLPYFFVAWKLQLAPYALVLEECSIAESFRRGWDMSRGSFFRFWGLFLVLGILGAGMGYISGAPLQAESRESMESALNLSGLPFDLLFVPLSALFGAIVTALGGVLWVVYYSDQRVRLEGLDLDLRLDELKLAGTAPEESA